MNTREVVNDVLVNLFKEILELEEIALIKGEFSDASVNDMHIIEAIGNDEPRSMSMIAKSLNITVGTLTTNMNSLEEKKYILRERSKTDKRVVLVSLTEKGRKAFFHHRDFHRRMIHSIVKDLEEDEMKVLIRCLHNLTKFFDEQNKKK